MNSRDEKKLSMYLVVADYLKENGADAQSAISKFKTLADSFIAGVPPLQHTREAQELNRKGKAVSKKQLRDSLILCGLQIAESLRAYALNEDDHDTAAAASYSKSALLRCADTILRDRCQVIHDAAANVESVVEQYNISQDMLGEFQIMIANFNAAIPKTREAVVARSTATRKLDEHFAAQDVLLKKMDTLALTMRRNYADFYNGYTRCRQLTKDGHRKLSLRGVITDENGKRLRSVCIKAAGISGSYKTTSKGNFQMKHIPNGAYILEVSKPGFRTKEVPIVITQGERCDVAIVLEA